MSRSHKRARDFHLAQVDKLEEVFHLECRDVLHEDDLVLIDLSPHLQEEVSEVGGGGGEDHLVRGEGGAPAAGECDVGEVLAAEDVP